MYGAGSSQVALYPLCSPLAAVQIGEQIEEDEMREMLAEADRSGTGRVGPHVEKAAPPAGAALRKPGSMPRRSAARLSIWPSLMASLIPRLSTSRWGLTTSCTS